VICERYNKTIFAKSRHAISDVGLLGKHILVKSVVIDQHLTLFTTLVQLPMPTSCHVMSCQFLSCSFVSCCVRSCHHFMSFFCVTVLCHGFVSPFCVIILLSFLKDDMSFHLILHLVLSCHPFVSFHVILCPCYASSFCVIIFVSLSFPVFSCCHFVSSFRFVSCCHFVSSFGVIILCHQRCTKRRAEVVAHCSHWQTLRWNFLQDPGRAHPKLTRSVVGFKFKSLLYDNVYLLLTFYCRCQKLMGSRVGFKF
jgi:hypothetical protein